MTSRSRTKGALTLSNYVQPWYSSDKVACTGSLVRTNRGNRTYADWVGDRRWMSDEIVPNYRKRSAAGEVIMTRMNSVHVILNPAMLGPETVYTGSSYQCSGASQYQSIYEFGTALPLDTNGGLFQPTVSNTWAPSSLLSNGEVENAIDEASTRCHSARGTAPVDFWESIAERKQSYVMLASYLDALKQTTQLMASDVLQRRGPFAKFVSVTNGVTSTAAGVWLISRYGLLPLLKDIRALQKQLSEARDEAERHTARGKAMVDRFVNTPFSHNIGHVTELGSLLLTDSLTVRAMSLDEWKLSLLDHYGLSPKGLATLPWELLTLSFVADWFVNLGDFFKGIVPLPAVNQLGCCITYQRVGSLTCTVTGYTGNGIASVASSGTMTKTGTRSEKVRIPGLRAPTVVRLNRSKIDPGLDANHVRIVDACALIGQRLVKVSNHLLANFPPK